MCSAYMLHKTGRFYGLFFFSLALLACRLPTGAQYVETERSFLVTVPNTGIVDTVSTLLQRFGASKVEVINLDVFHEKAMVKADFKNLSKMEKNKILVELNELEGVLEIDVTKPVTKNG